MPSAAQRYRQDFVPGQMVPISGVYTVVHQSHREEHQVIAIRGEEFRFAAFAMTRFDSGLRSSCLM